MSKFGHLDSKLGVLRPSWLQVERSGGYLGSKLRGLGAILAPSWVGLGLSWLQVGRSWGHLGSKLGGIGCHLGSKLGGLGSKLGHLDSKLGVKLALKLHVVEIAKNIEKSMIFIVF